MKKETFNFIRFGKLNEFVTKEVFGLKDFKFPSDEIQFDDLYEGDLLYNLKKSFILLNHMNSHSYIGVYHGKTGWLTIEKIKSQNKVLKIEINTFSKDIEFKLSGNFL